MPTSEAQDEFNALIYGTGRTSPSAPHPEDTAAHDDTDSKSTSPPSKTIRSASEMHQHYDSDSDTTPPASSADAKMRAKYYIPHVRSEANTGPKGVIADAQAFQIARLAHRSAAASRANLTVPAAYADEPKESMDRPQSWLLDEDEESDEDDDFLMRWRQNRLREMAVHAQRNGRSRSAAGTVNKFGSLVAVDAEGYLDAIEKVGRDTVVVVFIYDERSEVSLLIEECVSDLARKHTTTRFVKLHYGEAEMEPAGVPAILAYRGGDKFAGLVPVLNEMSDDDDLSADTLAAALRRHAVLA